MKIVKKIKKYSGDPISMLGICCLIIGAILRVINPTSLIFPSPLVIIGILLVLFFPGWWLLKILRSFTCNKTDLTAQQRTAILIMEYAENITLSLLCSIAIASIVVYSIYLIRPQGSWATEKPISTAFLAINGALFLLSRVRPNNNTNC